jgi:hypothetical protein
MSNLLTCGTTSFILCLSLWLISLSIQNNLKRNHIFISKTDFLRNRKSFPREMIEITPSRSSILLLFRLKYVSNSTATSLESRKTDDKAVISMCRAVYEQVGLSYYFSF